jgi:hypothetical protein
VALRPSVVLQEREEPFLLAVEELVEREAGPLVSLDVTAAEKT